MGKTPIFDINNESIIGSGIYGDVKSANYTSRNITVAVKKIDLDNYFNSIRVNTAQKYTYIERIKQRISEIKKLEGNNYQNIYFNKYIEETDEESNILYLGMEKCKTNLFKYLKERKINGGLDVGEIHEILTQLNNTFQIMSNPNINIIHGNIKLENILVNTEGYRKIFKLTGFEIIPELVRLTKIYKQNKICKYLPPELLGENNFTMDQKTDLWSLGVIIYFLFFGEFPFNGQTCKNVKEEILKKQRKKTNFTELDDLIDGLLEINKDQRLTWEKYFNHPFFKLNGFWRKYSKNKNGQTRTKN